MSSSEKTKTRTNSVVEGIGATSIKKEKRGKRKVVVQTQQDVKQMKRAKKW